MTEQKNRSASSRFLGILSWFLRAGPGRQHKEADPWKLPIPSSPCYRTSLRFSPHRPTQTFVVIVAGWFLSQRHRYITEVIFSGGQVGNGHWWRFHRFFSHAAWDIDTFSMGLAKLVVTILAPAPPSLVLNDTLCRKRGLTLYGANCTTTRSSPVVPSPWSIGGTTGSC